MSARRTTSAPARLLAAVALSLVAVLTLTACQDGEGIRDEGPSSVSAQPRAHHLPAHLPAHHGTATKPDEAHSPAKTPTGRPPHAASARPRSPSR